MTDTLEISVLSRAKLKQNLVNSDKCIFFMRAYINKQTAFWFISGIPTRNNKLAFSRFALRKNSEY